ncbi:hypothetical protein F5050DRAFT_1905848 [Lentinula boryana]|uniref:Uncharacterized protein n=1 Tax=Lentinula boryana TaxID=40481 RepID=A0ABQ8PYN5_9AGAR|nr:hypothetical protein F5050DRAFT_1905848 [Lentinula boryana]
MGARRYLKRVKFGAQHHTDTLPGRPTGTPPLVSRYLRQNHQIKLVLTRNRTWTTERLFGSWEEGMFWKKVGLSDPNFAPRVKTITGDLCSKRYGHGYGYHRLKSGTYINSFPTVSPRFPSTGKYLNRGVPLAVTNHDGHTSIRDNSDNSDIVTQEGAKEEGKDSREGGKALLVGSFISGRKPRWGRVETVNFGGGPWCGSRDRGICFASRMGKGEVHRERIRGKTQIVTTPKRNLSESESESEAAKEISQGSLCRGRALFVGIRCRSNFPRFQNPISSNPNPNQKRERFLKSNFEAESIKTPEQNQQITSEVSLRVHLLASVHRMVTCSPNGNGMMYQYGSEERDQFQVLVLISTRLQRSYDTSAGAVTQHTTLGWDRKIFVFEMTCQSSEVASLFFFSSCLNRQMAMGDKDKDKGAVIRVSDVQRL